MKNKARPKQYHQQKNKAFETKELLQETALLLFKQNHL